jgi:hypothetical protein
MSTVSRLKDLSKETRLAKSNENVRRHQFWEEKIKVIARREDKKRREEAEYQAFCYRRSHPGHFSQYEDDLEQELFRDLREGREIDAENQVVERAAIEARREQERLAELEAIDASKMRERYADFLRRERSDKEFRRERERSMNRRSKEKERSRSRDVAQTARNILGYVPSDSESSESEDEGEQENSFNDDANYEGESSFIDDSVLSNDQLLEELQKK